MTHGQEQQALVRFAWRHSTTEVAPVKHGLQRIETQAVFLDILAVTFEAVFCQDRPNSRLEELCLILAATGRIFCQPVIGGRTCSQGNQHEAAASEDSPPQRTLLVGEVGTRHTTEGKS